MKVFIRKSTFEDARVENRWYLDFCYVSEFCKHMANHSYLKWFKEWLKDNGATEDMMAYAEKNTYPELWPLYFDTKQELISFYSKLFIKFEKSERLRAEWDSDGDAYIYTTDISRNGVIKCGKPRVI